MKKNIILNLIIFTTVTFIACKKHEVIKIIEVEQNKAESVNCYIDNLPVSKADFEIKTKGMYLVELHKPTSNLELAEVEKRAYTSEAKYVVFGKKFGLDLDKQLIFERIMSNYSVKSQAITEFEKSGKLPTSYQEREKFVYDSLFNKNSKILIGKVQSGLTTLHDYPYDPNFSGGGTVIMAGTLPFMFPGWNDRVSSIEILGIGSAVTVYDRTFYRSRLSTVVNWGFQRINLDGGADNKMSSGISF